MQALYACRPFRVRIIQLQDEIETHNMESPISIEMPGLDGSSESDDSTKLSRQSIRRSKFSSLFSAMTGSENSKRSMKKSPTKSSNSLNNDISEDTLLFATRRLFMLMNQPQRKRLGFYSPRQFIQRLKASNETFRNSNQHDAHEFFIFIINDLNETFSKQSKNNSSCIQELFQGTLSNETKCLSCENVSKRKENFMDLSIDIDQNISLTAAIKKFSKKELMNQGNKFYCDFCRCNQEAERSMKIQYSPPILVLHLKRFQSTENLGKFLKLNYRVPFPMELKLPNLSEDSEIDQVDQMYRLVAIVVHIGNGPNQGHYVTVAYSHGTWILYDDDQVHQVEEAHISSLFGQHTVTPSPISTETAYILFYSRIMDEMEKYSSVIRNVNINNVQHSKSNSFSRTKQEHVHKSSLNETVSFSSSS